jgi:glycosyltransferase involved in cell wall biosynthesis
MQDRPLFTIIMATYNRANILPRAIRSVLTQTYQNLELLIVDDGSTDNTEEIVRSFKDSRIVYYKQENRGVLAARNRGLDLGTGEYITLLDDDDELVPNALEITVRYFWSIVPRSVKIIWFDGINRTTECITNSGGELDCRDKDLGKSGWGLASEGSIYYRDLLYGKIGGNHWQVVRREIIGANRFDEKLYCGEVIFWLGLHKKDQAYHVPLALRINHQDSQAHVSGYRSMLNHLPGLILTNKSWLAMYDQKNKSYYKRLAILRLYQVLETTRFIWKR